MMDLWPCGRTKEPVLSLKADLNRWADMFSSWKLEKERDLSLRMSICWITSSIYTNFFYNAGLI